MRKGKMTRLGTLFIASLLSFSGTAQEYEEDNIKVFEGAGDMEGIGFYSVYQAEGEKGKYRNYTVDIFDYSYSKIGSEKVELSKRAAISSSISNKSHLAIAFSDSKEKQISIKSFNQNGELAGDFNVEGGAIPNAELYKAPDGFIAVNMVPKGGLSAKILYEIISLGNDMSVKWRMEIDDENIREVVDVLATDAGIVMVYTSGKGMKKENYGQHMMRISNDGEIVFDEVFANNYYYFPNKILVDDGNTYIFGSYPEEGKSKPIGVFAIGFDADGSIIVKKELEYEQKISPEIEKISSDFDVNMKDEPQFIVNDAVKTDEGFYIVTETIQLRPAVGVGVQVSTGAGSGGVLQVNTTFIMGDFIVLKLNPSLELEKVKIVTKEPNKVTMEGTVFNVNQYHHVLKKNNVSNYQYWVKNDEGNPTMIYTIRKNFRSNIQIGAVDLTSSEDLIESKPTESDLEKLKELGYFGVLKGVDNKLTVYTYKKKVFSFYTLEYAL